MIFWRKTLQLVLLCGAWIGLGGAAHAAVAGDAVMQLAQAGPQFGQLPPEQRRQLRQQMREHWQQMPQDERQEQRPHFHAERQERREGFQAMPAEDRNRMRQELRGRREGWDDGGRGRPDNGFGRGRH